MTSFTIQELEQLKYKMEKNPNSMLFARLADYHLNRNEIDRALEIAQKGIDIHTDYATGFFVLAKCLLKLRRYEEAEKALKKVLLLDPKFLLAHKYHGDLLKDIGGWDTAAEASYRKILEIDPLDEDIRAMLEALTQKQKAVTEEEKQYPPIDELEPTPMISEKLTDKDLLVVTETEEEQEAEPSLEQISDRLDFDDEEARFSSILDDIFGEKLAKEEKRVEDSRKIIESISPAKKTEQSGFKSTEAAKAPTVGEESNYEKDARVKAFEIKPDFIPPVPKQPPEEIISAESSSLSAIAPDQKAVKADDTIASEIQDKAFKKDRIVTPTLGEIYSAQGQYEKAITVFETLMEKQPDNQLYKDKIKYLKQKLAEQQDSK